MIERQAEIISDLRDRFHKRDDKIVQLTQEVARLEGAAQQWFDLQQQILQTPVLQAEWDRFVMFLKLGADERYLIEQGEIQRPGGPFDG